jgi:hypothetical protein
VPPVQGPESGGLEGLAERLRDEMRGAIDQSSTATLISDQQMLAVAGPDAGGLAALARATDATQILAARYSLSGTTVSVGADLLDSDGSLVRSLGPVGGSSEALPELIERLRTRVAVAVLMLAADHDQFAIRNLSFPGTVEAWSAFENGREQEYRSRFGRAADWHIEAVRADPAWPAPYLFLIPSLANSGRGGELAAFRADAEALLPDMTPFEREDWVFQLGATDDDRFRAAIRMSEITGGGGLATYVLAYRAMHRNRLDVARSALDRMDYSHPALCEWWPAWWMDTKIHHLLGQYPAELTRAQEGRARFPEQHRLAAAEGRAHAALMDPAAAVQIIRDLRAMAVPSDSAWVAMQEIALEIDVHSGPEPASGAFDTIVAWMGTQASLSQVQWVRTLYGARQWAGVLERVEPKLADPVSMSALDLTELLTMAIVALEHLGRSDEASALQDRLPDATPAGRSELPKWRGALFASRGDAVSAVDKLIAGFSAGMRYYSGVDDNFIHVRPEFGPIRDDRRFQQMILSAER